MGNEMGNTNVSGFKEAEDQVEPRTEAEAAADDDAGSEIHHALLVPSSGAKDSVESLQVLSSSPNDKDDAFGRNEETTLCARDRDSNQTPQMLSTEDDPFGGHKETPSCARDSQNEDCKISQLASDTKIETDVVENAQGEAQNDGELLFEAEHENLSASENIVEEEEDENLSTKEDDQNQLSGENLESLAPENIVSIEDENLTTKEDDQNQLSSERLESLLVSSQNHQLDCEISKEQLIPEITLTMKENESESESSIFSNHETMKAGNESIDNTLNDHSLVGDFTFDPPEEEKSTVKKLEATAAQNDQIPECEDNEEEDATDVAEVVAMSEEETRTSLSIESISENPCLQMELTKSPSFGFGFPIEPRIEESDQTPLLGHGGGAAATSTEKVTRRSLSGCDEQEKVQVEEEIKTIKMEKSDDCSEESRGESMRRVLREEGEKQDGSLMGKKEAACIDFALASSKSGSWKNKMKHSFFSSCICCAASPTS